MILHEFPNLQWLKAQANSRFTNQRGVGGIELKSPGWPSVIINTRTESAVRDNIRGPLSVFTNLAGESHVTVEKRRVKVTPQTFFVSNTDQYYTLEVATKRPTETFNIHFGERFVADAIPSILNNDRQLLDNVPPTSEFGFYNRIIPVSHEFLKITKAVRDNGHDPLCLDEKLFDLLTLLLHEEGTVRSARQRLTSLRSTTREEILRRLFDATDYMYTCFDRNPSLDELAAISCLSKFHFLRLFRIAYQQTPHQFITNLKIQQAKNLLQKTQSDVRIIAAEVGFRDSSTFSRAFHQRVGVYPSAFRANS
jgi:AraC family transcriptional regulator